VLLFIVRIKWNPQRDFGWHAKFLYIKSRWYT
jgi:hypothetical protein